MVDVGSTIKVLNGDSPGLVTLIARYGKFIVIEDDHGSHHVAEQRFDQWVVIPPLSLASTLNELLTRITNIGQ